MSWANKQVLLVGAGGLGSPVATLLARAGVGRIEVLDDDRVELANLHRQTLYRESDVGQPKASLAASRIVDESCGASVAVAREMRLYPDVALQVVRGFDLVVEGADNYPTKFMVADACELAQVPCVQAGAVRWGGWVLGHLPGRSACLRCVFEDVPEGPDQGCSVAGVVGPVVGVLGALQAVVALRLLRGETSAGGVIHHYRALAGELRSAPVQRSPRCALCTGAITQLDPARYVARHCAA
jgi:molybdopterin/thiamine biosynthesis adenylyltransferase